MEFIGLGGVNEVGASSYLYKFKEGNLLIDAGLRPSMMGDAALPNLELLKDPENKPSAMVISHAHLDHVGAIPRVCSMFKSLPLYCTAATARIMQDVLADILKIGQSSGEPVFDAKMMKRTLENIRVIEYFKPVVENGMAFMLVPSGHLLGAGSIAMECAEGKVFHTADFSNVATVTTNPVYMPPELIPQSAVVTEATYGDTNLPSRKEQVRNFTQSVAQTLRSGGKVLIPSFALGRAQEMVSILLSHMMSGLLPKVPIYLDGLVRGITGTYEELLPHLPEALQNQARSSKLSPFSRDPVVMVKDAKERERICEGDKACVVIASSGMLHAGASPVYAKAWLPHPENALMVVGYQDAESPGRRLLELQSGGEVMLATGQRTQTGKQELEQVTVKAQVQRYYLSAHADRMGIINLLSRYPSEKVILTHGEHNARMALKADLDKDREVHNVKNGDVVDLLAAKPHFKRKDFAMPGKRTQERLAAEQDNQSTVEIARAYTPELPIQTQSQASKIRFFQALVEGCYNPETRELCFKLPENKRFNPELLPNAVYELEIQAGTKSKLRINQKLGRALPSQPSPEEAAQQVEDEPPQVENNSTAENPNDISLYEYLSEPRRLSDIAETLFSGNTNKAYAALNKACKEGVLQKQARGVYARV